MELFDAIDKRQSARAFTADPVKEGDILKIVEAAGKAPSGKNIQNWHFIVIENKEIMGKIGQIVDQKNADIAKEMEKVDVEKAHRFRKFVKYFTLFSMNAPAFVVVFTTRYYPSGYHELKLIDAPQETIDQLFLRDPGMQSLGAAVENFSLAAVDLGYGTCWLTSMNYAAHEIETFFKEALGFHKEGYFLGATLALGVPDESRLKSPKKKSLEEIFTYIK